MDPIEHLICQTCAHFNRVSAAEGECRPHPPYSNPGRVMGDVKWQIVKNNEWCGEWLDPRLQQTRYRLECSLIGTRVPDEPIET